MISLATNVKRLEKLAIDNSPGLLTAVGVVGLVGTAVLTHRAATRSLLEFQQLQMDGHFDTIAIKEWRKEKLKVTWKFYIPPVVSSGMTIAAIVGANRIGSKRAAAMAAAYTISEKAYSEYREKVIEKIGEAKERDIRDNVSRSQLENTPMTEKNVVIMGSGEVLCFDQWSGRYFTSSVEEIKAAVNEVNFMVNHNGYASLTDFYDQIGLPRTQESEEVGWTADKLLEVHFATHLADDGRPCVSFQFQVHPVRGFHKSI